MQRSTPNAVQLGLTPGEFEVYSIVRKRHLKGKTTANSDVAEAWDKSRTYVYRTLRSLVDKGLVERYSGIFYRLAE